MPSVVPFVLGQQSPDDTDLSLLPRPDLVAQLAKMAQNRVTLISAPTGSGKSVLLYQYRQQSLPGFPRMFLKLDQQDKDPILFYRRLALCVREQVPEFTGFACLQHRGADSQAQAQLATDMLVVGLRQLRQPLLIMIDNLELLARTEWLPSFHLLLELSPENVHWILAGRNTAALDLQPWFLDEQAGLLTQEGLFFTPQQVLQYLRNTRPQAAQGDADSLHQLTRGWPAAVKLAQLCLHYQPQDTPLDSTLIGPNVFHGLCDRLMGCLPQDLRHFLVQTAFLESLSAPLCNHTLNIITAEQHLRHLQQLALFIERDEAPGAFSFHPLFRQYLRDAFGQLPAAIRDRTLARACLWLVEHGRREDACRIARLHSQNSFFIELLRQSLRAWFRAGEAEPVFFWSHELGSSTLMAIPETRFAWSWALSMFGEFNRAEQVIRDSLLDDHAADDYQLLLSQQPQNLATILLLAIIKLFRGELPPSWIAQLQQRYNQPDMSIDHRASLDNVFAQYAIHHCHFREARQHATQALQMWDRTGNVFGQSLSRYLNANACYQNNDLPSALEACNHYLTQSHPEETSSARALLEGFRAFLLYQADRPVQAEQLAQDILLHYQPGYSVDLLLFLTVPQLHMRARRGEFVEAECLLRHLEQAIRANGSQMLEAHLVYEKLRLAYAMRQTATIEYIAAEHRVLQLAEQALTGMENLLWETTERRIMAAVLVLIHRGEIDNARRHMQQLQYLGVDQGYPIRFLPINLGLAYLDHLSGNVSAAFRRLNDTLTQAAATGMLTGLLDDIPGMETFVRQAIDQGRILNPRHVERLLETGLLDCTPPADSLALSPCEQALEDRVMQGMTLAAAAEQLNLSHAAAQWHWRYRCWKRDQPLHRQ